ncbi:hypothetical protein BDF14DRAFT_1839134 [Spinellus fusiger]|nr:hypothetical protein BDF14DRAFT_1839134 [Spinellus fusiger]
MECIEKVRGGGLFIYSKDVSFFYWLLILLLQIFMHLGKTHWALDIKYMKAHLGLCSGSTDSQKKVSLWDMSQVLLLALESEDNVRACAIETTLLTSECLHYPDVELIVQISRALRFLDIYQLEKQLPYCVDHVDLLIESRSESLLMQQVEKTREEQRALLDRLCKIMVYWTA